MFISNRQSRRKQNLLSSTSIKSAPKSTFNHSANSSNHSNQSAEGWVARLEDLQRSGV